MSTGEEDGVNFAELTKGLDQFTPNAGVEPQHFKVVLGEQEEMARQIACLLPDLIVKLEALPEGVSENNFFSFLLQHPKRIAELGHRRLLIPYRSNEEPVQKVLREIAATIEEEMPKEGPIERDQEEVRRKIFLALNIHLREELEKIFCSPIMSLEKGKKISPKNVRDSFHKVESLLKPGEEKIMEKQAAVALFYELGIISAEEIKKLPHKNPPARIVTRGREITLGVNKVSMEKIEDINSYNTKDLEEEIEESLHWASSDFIKRLLTRIEDLGGEYEAEGILTGENELPELNQALRAKAGVFQLLRHLYSGGEVRDLNDAQILLIITLVHFIQERRYKEMETNKLTKVADSILLDSLFEADSLESISFKTLFYKNGEFNATGASRKKSCRILKTRADVPKSKKLVSLVEVDDKRVTSRVKKYFAEGYGEAGPDQVPDEIRTRGILMGVTSDELAQPGPIQNMVIDSLIETAKSLGLKHDRTEELRDEERPGLKLLPGDYVIEKDFTHPNYPKINLLGVTGEGLHVEIQFITVDTHAFEIAHGSGMHHEVKDEVIELKIIKDMAIQSVSPVTHTIANRRLKELKELRNDTAKARKAFMTANPEFFKQAA